MEWLAYSFRGSAQYHHEGEHGSMQADMVLEGQLEALHLAGNRQWSETLGGILCIGNFKAYPTVTDLFQQGYNPFEGVIKEVHESPE